MDCLVCSNAGQETPATQRLRVYCPTCGFGRPVAACDECATQLVAAPDESLLCDDCRRKMAMSR